MLRSAFGALCPSPDGLYQVLHPPVGTVGVLLPAAWRPGVRPLLISPDRLVLIQEWLRLGLKGPPECH